MTQQNPPPNFHALVARVKTMIAAVAFTGGWDHEPKLPAGGVSTTGQNHFITMRARDGGNLCTYLASGLTNASAKPEEINAFFEYIEQSLPAIQQMITAVEQQQVTIANQQVTIGRLESQLQDCQKKLPTQP